MTLVLDRLIHEVGSQSNPKKKYEVRLRKDDEGHIWLSCDCKSWCVGPYQRGKPIYLRYCKHTDRTILERAVELSGLGYVIDGEIARGTAASLDIIAEVVGKKKFEPVKSGLSRRVRK